MCYNLNSEVDISIQIQLSLLPRVTKAEIAPKSDLQNSVPNTILLWTHYKSLKERDNHRLRKQKHSKKNPQLTNNIHVLRNKLRQVSSSLKQGSQYLQFIYVNYDCVNYTSYLPLGITVKQQVF